MTPGKDYIGATCCVAILNEDSKMFMMKRAARTRNDHGLRSINGGKLNVEKRLSILFGERFKKSWV